jgi:hypothetical protein
MTLVGQSHLEILKPLKMVLCSSCEIVSFKKNVYKLAGLPVFYSGSNESSLAPQLKWLDNTFKIRTQIRRKIKNVICSFLEN